MHIRTALSLSVLGALAMGLGGCGIVSKDFEGNVRVQFEVNDEDHTYEDTVVVNPDEYEDVKENRDKIKEGSVLSITIDLNEVLPGNAARQVAGQIDVRRVGQGDDAWLTAVGSWAGIPLYDEQGQPYIGQRFKLDLSPDSQDELSRIAFEERDPLEFRIVGYGLDDNLQPLGPVRIRGEVDVLLHVTVGVP